MNPTPIEIGQRIKAERERLCLTQDEMAYRLGVSRGSYRQVEEHGNPRLANLLALAEILDLRRVVPELFEVK